MRWVDDIWDFDQNGKFISRTENKDFDQIRIWDEDRTNIIAQTEKLKYGTIKHNRPFLTIDEKKVRHDIFRIQGDDNAQMIFEMFAENTYGNNSRGERVNLEWSHVKIGSESSGSNVVGTSHSTEWSAVGEYLFKTNYTMRASTHNHPSGNPRPSTYPGDLQVAQPWIEKFPNLQLNIYIKEGGKWGYLQGYYNYDKIGPTWGAIVKP